MSGYQQDPIDEAARYHAALVELAGSQVYRLVMAFDAEEHDGDDEIRLPF